MYKQEDFHHRKSSCFYSKTIEKYMRERKKHKIKCLNIHNRSGKYTLYADLKNRNYFY